MPDHGHASPNQAISFGRFRLVPSQQNGRRIRLGNRALDLLIALIARPNEIISKEEHIARVWPDTFVEEGNLRVHVAALRRVLGNGQVGFQIVINTTNSCHSATNAELAGREFRSGETKINILCHD